MVMTTEEKWSARVEAWRHSGTSAGVFCKDKEFTASGLRYWASRLRRAEAAQPKKPQQLRLARIVGLGEADLDTPIVVEAFGVRVGVRRGFDREALGAVLEVLAERGAR